MRTANRSSMIRKSSRCRNQGGNSKAGSSSVGTTSVVTGTSAPPSAEEGDQGTRGYDFPTSMHKAWYGSLALKNAKNLNSVAWARQAGQILPAADIGAGYGRRLFTSNVLQVQALTCLT